MENTTYIKGKKKPLVKLYRYFSNIDYALSEIESGEIFLTFSHAFNDPFDCRITNDGSVLFANQRGYIKEIRTFINKILLECPEFIESFFLHYDFEKMESDFLNSLNGKRKIYPFDYLSFIHKYSNREDSFDEFMNMLKESFIKKQPVLSISKKVACFSEVNDSILMWSYYANKHTGICLEYTPSELLLGNDNEQNIFQALQKVFYSENQYNQSRYFNSEDDIYDVFFNKAQCWAHEQEWRIVLNENVKTLAFPCLTGIYLGANFRSTYRERSPFEDCYFKKVIKSAIHHTPRIPVYEAKLNNAKYQIDFETILPIEHFPK